MAKNTVTVEIKGIPVDVEIPELGYVEITDLATQVEQEMRRELEENDVIDTLKQALTVALKFAAKSYLNEQTAGGKQQEESGRVDQLIGKLQSALDATKK